MSYEAWGEPDDYECPQCGDMMSERDEAQEAADRLAHCIADMLGVDIGEHSNLNCPWKEAGDYADAMIAGRATLLGGWQPIATAPRDGTEFWAYLPKREGCMAIVWWHDDLREPSWRDHGDTEPEPTHWMSLPGHPTAE